MKNHCVVSLVCLASLLISSPSFASVQGFQGNVSSPGAVASGEGYYFTIAGTNNGCAGYTSQFVIPSNVTGYQEMVANVLLAYATGKQVFVYSNGCYNGRGDVISISILP